MLAREFPTQAGPIDILAVDELGTLYVIETKLYRNPDKRNVVAQVLDYGAALWRHSSDFADFRLTLAQQVQKQYGTALEDQIASAFGKDEDGTSQLLQATADCLTNPQKASVRKGVPSGRSFVLRIDSIVQIGSINSRAFRRAGRRRPSSLP